MIIDLFKERGSFIRDVVFKHRIKGKKNIFQHTNGHSMLGNQNGQL